MIGEVVEELLMTVKHVSYIFFIYIFKSKMDSDNLESAMPFDLKEGASVVGGGKPDNCTNPCPKYSFQSEILKIKHLKILAVRIS